MTFSSAATRPPVPAVDLGRRITAGVLSAIVVVVVALAVTSLAFFIGGQQATAALTGAANFFLVPTIVAGVLLAIFNSLGATRWWLPALAGGLGAGLIGAVLGSVITVAGGGAAVDAAVLGQIVASLLGFNLFFVLAVTLGEVTLGRSVTAVVLGYRSGEPGDSRRIALVRIPAENLADGMVTHIERESIDTQVADEQWDNYCAALTAEGWSVVEVPAEPQLADSVFVEDAVVMFGDLALITSPGSEARRAEIAGAEESVRTIPGVHVERIELPGTLDGGDVLKVGSTVYVGRSTRTNAEGIRQLRVLLAPLGYTVVAVPLTKALHLKSAATALPDGTVIGYPPLLDDTTVFDRFVAVPEAGGAHVVELAPDTVLMAGSAPVSAALISDLGYRVVTVDISEFEKLEGCVTCLSVRVR
ncbi:dimethylargininase [Leifsonia sp. Leaf264]|uniref:dimethylargininase n=1 Tax=Leifsonia sp. Leaf264 TaxID=1736314 RepID=UPI0006F5B9DA|nr:dimethylargininase [Leifsonia sp. Leaf264]KQO94447.1 dimethylarginine dimethylaminohydrolase [Leifsonia sp. Leaf264]